MWSLILFLCLVASTLFFEGGGFQLARGDPSFEVCVFFAFAGSACVFALVLAVASPVVVLLVVFNWIPRYVMQKQKKAFTPLACLVPVKTCIGRVKG